MDFDSFMSCFAPLKYHMYLFGLAEAVSPRDHFLPEFSYRRNQYGRLVYVNRTTHASNVAEDESASKRPYNAFDPEDQRQCVG